MRVEKKLLVDLWTCGYCVAFLFGMKAVGPGHQIAWTIKGLGDTGA